MGRVTVVNYGMGNLLSVARAFEHSGAEVLLTEEPDELERAERVVLPGVGAFADGMEELRARGFVEPLREYARSGRPLLGICLGMHMLMDESSEFGVHEGLGIVHGAVTEIPRAGSNGHVQKVPHIGWSALIRDAHADESAWSESLLGGISQGEAVYFVHSYAVAPASENVRIAESVYGSVRIPAVIRDGTVFGTQFHPEKSGDVGLRLIRNFVAQTA
jgi:glutamine amidotransferase